MKTMPEHPHIYPYKRVTETAIAKQRTVGKKRAIAAVAEKTAKCALLCVVFFLMSRAQILGGLHPFGPACFAAAAVVWPRKGALFALPVLLGLLTVTDGQTMLVYAAVIILLAIVFSLYTLDGRKQWFVMPGMVAAAVMVSKGLYIALSGYTDFQLLLSLFECLIAAGLSLVFLIVLTALRRFDIARRFSADETVCFFVALIGLICGLSGWSIGIIDMQSMLSRLLIIIAAFLGGGGAGAAVGALVGVAPSLSQMVPPTVIATYAFSGLLSGVFANFGRIGSAVGFVLGNLILALYMLDPADISTALAASAAAGLVFLIIPGKAYKAAARAFTASGIKSSAEEKNERSLRMAIRKMKSSGDAFRGLADSLSSWESGPDPDRAPQGGTQYGPG
ncbi:MAG: hypothetical protein J6T26_02595, partial [Firmicutes bacterium]|nr:hypothetical protein [Bacillota bacterium]